jgi:transposase
MNNNEIFEMALGITEPWYLQEIKFTKGEAGKRGRLDIYMGYKPGSKFKDNEGNSCSVYDTDDRMWRHLNFFENESYIHCKLPRIKTKKGKVETIEVPWARRGSGFTLLFEAFGMLLIENEMPLNKASKTLNIVPHRLWRIFKYWVSEAISKQDIQTVKKLGIDETSIKKGHNYITVAVDMNERRVIYVTRGKDAETLSKMKIYSESKGLRSSQITEVSMDMSPAYISGVMENFEEAKIIFDRFHVMKTVNEAMDKVRKQERREHEELRGHRYLFLKSNEHLSDRQKKDRTELIELLPTIGEAYRLKELIKDFWEFSDPEESSGFLSFWCDMAIESKIPAFQEVVKTIKSHWTGILNYTTSRINNGILEGINSKIQLAKRRARGFRNTENFINMVYFIAGKLQFGYPH